MKTKKRLFGWLCLLCITITLAAITACSSANEEISSPIETVKNPTKVVNYEDSKYFKDDLETMMDYAHSLQAMRWAAMCVMSNDFKYDDLSRPATIEDVERNTTSMPRLFQIEQYVVEHAAEYEAALERLEQGGALDDPAKTRGPLGDGLAFILGCRKSQVLGRKSVLAVMRKTGSTTNTAELQRLYNLVPAEQRRGYSDAVTFWTDFSAGKLDSRANVIFQNLYTYDYMNFGSTAKDMGISPAGNMAKTTADLVEKGGSLIISAAPGNLSSSLGYSKDIWQTYQVAGEVGSNLFSGKLSTEDGKKVLQQVFNLACNYADQLKNYAETRKFEGTMDLIDDWDFFAAVDVLNTTVNGSVFGDELLQLFPPELAEKIVPQVTFITDKNGNQIPLVILRDNTTGDVCVSYTLDKDGNIMMVPKDFGTKTLTVVDRDGHRHTKTVLVDENTNIEIDMEEMEKEETVLEDEPSHGYLLLQPGIITEKFGLSSTDEIRVRTNYLYYTCHTEDKWISASPKTDISQVVVRLAANDTGEKREGKVFVIATNKAGKPLKTEVIEVTQMPKEAAGDLIWTTPTSVSFAPDGGKQSIVVNHAVGYSFIGCMEGSDLAGWCYLEATESDAGSPTYIINCEPNNTNEERSGTVTFYTANSKSALEAVLYSGAKPDGTTVAATTVLIKQEAGGESDFEVNLITIAGHFKTVDHNGNENMGENLGGAVQTKDGGSFTVTTKGKGLHIEGSGTTYPMTGMTFHTHISLDIDDVSLIESQKSTITNLNLVTDTESVYTYGEKTTTSEGGAQLTAANIPMSDDYAGLKYWKGSGITGYSWSSTTTYHDGRTETSTMYIVENPANYIEVWIGFKDGSSARARLTH